ncbi:MAG TPA: ROK family transcriptional regulator [Anaerolineales bacterium]|nr:ROK family transcriptional regulator [Anaerolineales bacterium]
MEKATRTHTKEHNRNLVLKTIFGHENISRADIARITNLTKSTVSDIVADLIAGGLVSEIGVRQSQGGKNPILLSLIEDSRWLIGLDLGQEQFRGAVVNLRGKIREVVTIPVNDCNGSEALSLVYQILDRLISSTNQPLSGIGVGTPGLINTCEGLVVNAVNLDWKNLPLTRLLEQRYHLPVSILNDCQAAAIGEKTYGKDYQQDENLVLMHVHHGIGAGIIIHREIFQGDGGFAGEIGHVVVVPDSREVCRCGKQGCLETVASAKALLRQARELAREHPDCRLARNAQEMNLETIVEAFQAGDPLTRELVLKTADYIGMAISSMVGILNIQKVVLEGDMTRFGTVWLDRIRAVMVNYSLDPTLDSTHVEIGQLGEDATILGAAAVFANNYSYLFTRLKRPDRSNN